MLLNNWCLQAVTMFLTSTSGTVKASQIPGFDSIEKPVDGNPKLRQVLLFVFYCYNDKMVSIFFFFLTK